MSPRAKTLAASLLLSAAAAADSPVLDSRFLVAGHTEEVVVEEGGRLARVTTVVHLDGGPSFPVDSDSPAYVSADRSRVLVAGGHLDPLMAPRRGGEALLYDGEGRLLRRLRSFTAPWLAPGPVVAVEPTGGSWIAADGRLERFDRDGRLAWSQPLPGLPMAIVLSPSGERVAVAVNTAAASPGPAPGAGPETSPPSPPALLLLDTTGRVLAAGSPASLFHAVEWVDEDTLVGVSFDRYMVLRRDPGGGFSVGVSGDIGGDLLGPYAVSASPRGWFALALGVEGGALVRVVETATGRPIAEHRCPGEVYTLFRRVVGVEGDTVRVFLPGREADAFAVPCPERRPEARP